MRGLTTRVDLLRVLKVCIATTAQARAEIANKLDLLARGWSCQRVKQRFDTAKCNYRRAGGDTA